MNLANVLLMLLGAALVAVGVLAAALADRIRGLRVPATRTAATRTARTPIEVVEAEVVASPPPAAPPKAARAPRAESKPQASDGADDVIAALVAAGYKKTIATEAVWGCGQDERTPVERWTRAALRLARGGAS
jgi:hypothetical protein